MQTTHFADGDFQLTIDTSTADPGLLAAVASGTRFDAATFRVRTPGADRAEYLSYAFTGVRMTNWSINAVDGDAPVGLVELDFESITQSRRTLLEKDLLDDFVVGTFDAVRQVGSGNLVLPETDHTRTPTGTRICRCLTVCWQIGTPT